MSAGVAVIGSFVQDLAFKVNEFPAAGQTLIGNFFTGPGGKGSNQAVACHRQEVPTVFIGAVGDDLFAAGYIEWSTKEELETRLLTVPGQLTGAASIIVNSRAENQIVVALGANDSLTGAHVLKVLRDERECAVVLLQAESNLGAAEEALKYSREHGLYSIFNPAPINPGVTPELLSLADCATPNETEFSFLVEKFSGKKCSTDFSKLSDDEIKELSEHIPSRGVLITLGALGSVYYQRLEPHSRQQKAEKGDIFRVPAIKVKPVDTTGAGDAFNGGLAAGFVRFGGDFPRAIRYATVVAGLSTEREGTAPAMPRRADVERHSKFFSE